MWAVVLYPSFTIPFTKSTKTTPGSQHIRQLEPTIFLWLPISCNNIDNAFFSPTFHYSPLQFREAATAKDDKELLRVMANYGMWNICYCIFYRHICACYLVWNHTASTGEDVVQALGYEVDRLESEIQKLVPGIKHVDIEAHNPEELSLRAGVLESTYIDTIDWSHLLITGSLICFQRHLICFPLVTFNCWQCKF